MTVSQPTAGEEARRKGSVVLLRHGQTAWSLSGQHTGKTDIPLTQEGRIQALEAGERLRQAFPAGFKPEFVYASPMGRAQETARLAGFDQPIIWDDLAEWDYGRAEGRTRQEISRLEGREWNLWRDGTEALGSDLDGTWQDVLPSGERVTVRNGPGETLDQVAARAGRLVARLEPLVDQGCQVLLVGHSHILRILTTQWLSLQAADARKLRLDTAHFGVLSRYKGDRVIERWNC